MQSTSFSGEADARAMRALRRRLGARATILDFDELILLPEIRALTRLWRHNRRLVGFAFVDDYNNLCFEMDPELPSPGALEAEMVAWGAECMRRRNAQTGASDTLDCSCSGSDAHRLEMLNHHGFIPQQVRSLRFWRALDQPVARHPLPAGFSLRCVGGEGEVERLVALHRAAFGTEHMTVAYRLAMMRTAQYVPELDLVAVAPDGELVAFCVCGFDETDRRSGYTDPIGTHPSFQRMGLGKAIVSAGLAALQTAGAQAAALGTSSENTAMQNLARSLGFICAAETLWFAKSVS